jgi:hypothetical protein
MLYNEIPDLIQRKYFGLKRRLLARALPIGMRYQVLNEYPKSGGSWIGEMFAAALGLAYPRDGNNTLQRSLIHGHFMSPFRLDNSIIVWRDGRDVLTSSYYYYTRKTANIHGYRSNRDLVAKTQRAMSAAAGRQLNATDISFSAFLRMMLTTPVYPKLTWPQFAKVWGGRPRCHHVKYEEFKKDAHGSLQRLVWAAARVRLPDDKTTDIVREHSFVLQAGRPEGAEDATSFFRKGVVGDWKNHFSPDDEDFFRETAGEAMQMLDYPW